MGSFSELIWEAFRSSLWTQTRTGNEDQVLRRELELPQTELTVEIQLYLSNSNSKVSGRVPELSRALEREFHLSNTNSSSAIRTPKLNFNSRARSRTRSSTPRFGSQSTTSARELELAVEREGANSSSPIRNSTLNFNSRARTRTRTRS